MRLPVVAGSILRPVPPLSGVSSAWAPEDLGAEVAAEFSPVPPSLGVSSVPSVLPSSRVSSACTSDDLGVKVPPPPPLPEGQIGVAVPEYGLREPVVAGPTLGSTPPPRRVSAWALEDLSDEVPAGSPSVPLSPRVSSACTPDDLCHKVPPPPPAPKGHISAAEQKLYLVAQARSAYDAVESDEYGARQTGYLAVEENEEVLLYKTTGAQGHSENRDVWYVYARKNTRYEYGWLPVVIIAGYFAFVARDYTAPDTNYLGVTKDERILLFTEADEEGHLIQITDLSYFFAKNDKNECGWIPVEVIGDYDVKLTFLQFQ